MMDDRYSEADEDEVIHEAELPLPSSQRVVFSFGFGNRMAIANSTGGASTLALVEWDDEGFHSTEPRKLAAESHGAFMSKRQEERGEDSEETGGRQDHGAAGGTTSDEALVNESRMFRAILRACVERINDALLVRRSQKQHAHAYGEDEDDEAAAAAADDEDSEQHMQLYRLMELVWHLCEVLFVDRMPGATIMVQLLEWLQWHFGDEPRVGQILAARLAHPEQHESYWSCVRRLAVLGRVNDCAELLRLHSDYGHSQALHTMDELLRRMPMLHAGRSAAEFLIVWSRWHDECVRSCNTTFAAGHSTFGGDLTEELHVLCTLLSGDEERLGEHTHKWYELLVAKMLYTQPTVKSFDLRNYVDECLTVFSADARTGLDNILIHCMEFDIHKVLRECSIYMGSRWFVTHLTDLLMRSGQLEALPLKAGGDLREHFMLDYASSLAMAPGLWPLACDYFAQCSEFGGAHLEAVLERISPLGNERRARKLARLADAHNLPETAATIARVVGVHAMRHGRPGTALGWFTRARDVVRLEAVADVLLQCYAQSGAFTGMDVIDSLGSEKVLSERLLFLDKYREMHRLYQSRSFVDCARLLVQLIASNIAPPEFRGTLLVDAVPLLETAESPFTAEQTYELMRCCENLSLASSQPQSTAITADQLQVVRLALARALARAIVM